MTLERETFGPVLRAERERRGLSLQELAARTKVRVELWSDLEENNFSRWPSRIYARAYVRDYASRVGLDADAVVNEFCRLFPEYGDRRADSLLRSHAEIVQHDLAWEDEPPPTPEQRDRRAPVPAPSSQPFLVRHVDRVVAVALDVKIVLALSSLGTLLRLPFWPVCAGLALVYHAVGVLVFDRTIGGVVGPRCVRLFKSMPVKRLISSRVETS